MPERSDPAELPLGAGGMLQGGRRGTRGLRGLVRRRPAAAVTAPAPVSATVTEWSTPRTSGCSTRWPATPRPLCVWASRKARPARGNRIEQELKIAQIIQAVGWLGPAALPVCVGIAIIKYRLYDIDRIVSRTLSGAIVTGLLVRLYLGLVALTTGVLGPAYLSVWGGEPGPVNP